MTGIAFGCIAPTTRFSKADQLMLALDRILLGWVESLPLFSSFASGKLSEPKVPVKRASGKLVFSAWKTFRLSLHHARSLLGVLTQKLRFEDFMRWNGLDRHAENYGAGNPFHNLKGLTLKEVRLEKCLDEDDDWLAFELEGNDPAVNPIVNPVIKEAWGTESAPPKAGERSD
jgi:hypothetical protein